MDYQHILRAHLLSKSNIDFLVSTILSHFKISPKAVTKCVNIITNNFVRDLNNLDRYPQNDTELMEAINFLNQKCYNDFRQYLSKKYPDKNLIRNFSSPDSMGGSNTTYEEVVIITEEEKNRLLKEYQKPENNVNVFLQYLTDPLILQMFASMINQCNSQQTSKKNIATNQIIIDKIFDINQLNVLLSETYGKNKAPDLSTEQNDTNENLIEEKDSLQMKEIKQEPPKEQSDENLIDLINLKKEDLPNIEKRIKELVQQKNKYIAEKNNVMIARLEEEKEKIINAVKEYKKKLEKEAKENETKINGMIMSKRRSDEENVEFLDLQFDPTNDFNDLKNIVIGFKTDNKISEIILVDYYVPFNPHNVTRFNNKFMVYLNNKMNRIIIPPGKYEIDLLLNYIKNQANFLEFSISEDKIITIKNTMNIKFDLMTDNDTIFPLLGFTERQDNYKDKLSYSGSQPYNINCNEKVIFTLSGSTIDPLELEFDKTIAMNKTLKKSRSGFHMKQMVLSFANSMGQCYDFIQPFKMCFKIIYAS